MTRLCQLIDAQSWLWAAAPIIGAEQSPTYLFHQFGGFHPEEMPDYLAAIRHPDTHAMSAELFEELTRTSRHLTRRRQDIVDDERFFNSPSHPLWVKAGIGPIMLSYRPLEDGAYSAVGLYRKIDAQPFSLRESKIAHIILSEVDWLHQEGVSTLKSRSLPALSPRCRMVFTHLLEGLSRKEIAEILGLSVHTINDYVKTVFLHFGVRSTPALLARFRLGNGQDTP